MTTDELRKTIHRPADAVTTMTPRGELKSLQQVRDEEEKKKKEAKL